MRASIKMKYTFQIVAWSINSQRGEGVLMDSFQRSVVRASRNSAFAYITRKYSAPTFFVELQSSSLFLTKTK